jgi:hypothetical protein
MAARRRLEELAEIKTTLTNFDYVRYSTSDLG